MQKTEERKKTEKKESEEQRRILKEMEEDREACLKDVNDYMTELDTVFSRVKGDVFRRIYWNAVDSLDELKSETERAYQVQRDKMAAAVEKSSKEKEEKKQDEKGL